MFASFIPEIANILMSGGKYNGRYLPQRGKKHIVLCGNINTSSLTTFFADFLKEDYSDLDVKVVILNR